VLGFLYALSGDVPREKRWPFLRPKTDPFMKSLVTPASLPTWLTAADVDFYTQEFERTGFRGGLNWYRNIDRSWQQSAFLSGANLQQPSILIAGEHDCVIEMYRGAYDVAEHTMPKLRKKVLLPGVGHWIQQERPSEVNALLLEFLASQTASQQR
jgi:pimeloyl-ACP methyl ester carboxylesterase